MRILVWVGMLDHSTHGKGFRYDPGPITLFQIVRNLHASARRAAALGTKFDFGVSLIPIYGDTANIHVHRAHVESSDAGEMLHDAGADSFVVADLLLAASDQNECC